MHKDKISIDPKIRFGKPCIKGTRISISDILNLVAAGYSIESIPAQYESISIEDVIAAIEYASQFMEHPIQTVIQS